MELVNKSEILEYLNDFNNDIGMVPMIINNVEGIELKVYIGDRIYYRNTKDKCIYPVRIDKITLSEGKRGRVVPTYTGSFICGNKTLSQNFSFGNKDFGTLAFCTLKEITNDTITK